MMTGSVSSAAAALHRTQPAVSRLLKDLEHTVGFDLFDRVKGRLIPTTKARTFFEQVQHSFVALERLGTVATDIRDDRFGRFSVAAFPAASLTLMTRVLSSILKLNTGMNLIYEMLPSDIVVQRVLTKECDLGFVNASFDFFGLIFERRYDLPCVCLLPEGHPLVDKDVIGLAELYEHPVIELGANTSFGAKLDYFRAQQGVTSSARVESNSAFSAAALVREGVGATITDPLTAADHKLKGGIVRKLSGNILFEVGIIRLSQDRLTKAQDTFISIFEKELHRMCDEVEISVISAPAK
jgi:DNA-binding transcriptional LysR family regulator